MPTRWTSRLSVGWHPILTFARRRLRFLDWVDGNFAYTSFRDDDESFGVGNSNLRLEFHRQGMTLELGRSDLGGRSSSPLVQAVVDILEPRHARLLLHTSVWSSRLQGDYATHCRRFAQRSLRLPSSSKFAPTDASTLVDFVGPSAAIQGEFGVVRQTELFNRLQKPEMSRLGGGSPAVFGALDLEDLPELAFFGSVSWIPMEDARITSASELAELNAVALSDSGGLMNQLAETIEKS